MNLNTFEQLRQQVYQCYERSADALFELGDALSSEAMARSLPEWLALAVLPAPMGKRL